MPLEERLELDIADALRGIDNIEDALTASAQAFKFALAEALDLLGNVAVGEVDAGNVTTAITEAVAAADLDPEVTADATGVTASIDEAVAAADEAVTVEGDASGLTDSIDTAVAEADATVEVEADASSITDAIDRAVAGGLQDVSGATDAISGAAAASTGSVIGLERGLGRLGAGGTIAAAGVTAVALSAGELFRAALEADTADRRFAESLGEIAERVEAIGISGFADGLEELAERTGASDEALKLAAARIGDLGNSANASQDEIAEAAENILLLAIKATVLNPTLGEAGQVADQLTNALARGERALAPFGISLSTAAIQARAVSDAGGDASAATDRFALAAAGAALLTERLGEGLKTDIVEGAKSTEIQLRSLQEQFGNTLETFGRPLLEPVLEAAREGQPILLDLAETFGELAGTILPVLIDVLRTAAPIISTVADVVQVLLSALQPVLAVVDAIPDPVLRAIATFALLSRAVGLLQVAIATLAPTTTLALGPLGLLVAGVGAAVAVFASLGNQQADTRQEVEALTQAFADQAEAIDADVEARSKQIIAEENVSDALRESGVSVRDFARLASEGTEGLDAFVSTLERTGQVSPEVAEKIRGAGGDIDALRRIIGLAIITGDGLTESNGDLLGSFLALADEAQNAAQAQIDNLVNTEAVTDAQARAAVAATQAGGSTANYVAALEALQREAGLAGGAVDAVTGSMDDATDSTADLSAELDRAITSLERNQEALDDLFDARVRALDAEVDAENASRDFGNALDDVAQAERDLTDARNDRTDATRDAISIERALNSVEDATQSLTEAERELARAREGRGQRAQALEDAEKGLAEAQKAVAEASQPSKVSLSLEDRERAAKSLTDAQERLADAEERLRDAREEGGAEADIREATERVERAQLSAREAALGLADAREQAADREIEAARRIGEAEDNLAGARLRARDAARDAAEAAVQLASDREEAAGRQLPVEERERIFRQSLLDTAAAAEGPVKRAILDLVATLDVLGTERKLELQANVDQAKATIDAYLRELDEQLKSLTFNITANRSALPGGSGGGFSGPGAMAGGSYTDGWLMTGEGGRELVYVQQGATATVIPNAPTERLLSSTSTLDAAAVELLTRIADRPRTEASFVIAAPDAATGYGAAREAAMQLDALAVRQSAT